MARSVGQQGHLSEVLPTFEVTDDNATLRALHDAFRQYIKTVSRVPLKKEGKKEGRREGDEGRREGRKEGR